MKLFTYKAGGYVYSIYAYGCAAYFERDGVGHRANGPSSIYKTSGQHFYYLNGLPLTKEQHEQQTKKLK